MKRAVLIIMSVAILGALGLYINKKPASTATASGSTTAVAADQTQSSAADNSSGSTSTTSSVSSGSYKDGTYTGKAVGNPYGTVQVAAVVSGGKISDIEFLQMPNDQGNSRQITSFSEPQLKQETLSGQSAHVDFVSGATITSESYEQSLQAALDQAAVS